MFFLEVARFLMEWDVAVLSAAFAAVWIFGAVNWIRNPYRKQNKQFEKCRYGMLTSPKLTAMFMAELPAEYRRQWRAFVNGNVQRPSLVFEFVPRKKRLHALEILVVGAVAGGCYVAVFFLDVTRLGYLVFQAAYWLAFGVVKLANDKLFAQKEKRARRIFGRFVSQLNAQKILSLAEKPVAERFETAQKVGEKDFLEQASEALRQSGLHNNRTVQEQRKINTALNSLLQAYARNARHIKERKDSIIT